MKNPGSQDAAAVKDTRVNPIIAKMFIAGVPSPALLQH
jgi:hypothetical protein